MSDPLPALEAATLRRVTRRLIPFMFVLYIANYLDRVNVSFAALQMNRDLGLSSAAYGLGAGMFFLVVTAWILLVVGNSFGTRLIQRGTDRGLELGFNYVTALITLEAGTWLLVGVLMLDGAARLWRDGTQRA